MSHRAGVRSVTPDEEDKDEDEDEEEDEDDEVTDTDTTWTKPVFSVPKMSRSSPDSFPDASKDGDGAHCIGRSPKPATPPGYPYLWSLNMVRTLDMETMVVEVEEEEEEEDEERVDAVSCVVW